MKTVVALMAAMLTAAPVMAGGSSALGTGAGRYVFGQVSDARRDQYMLDTQTGRMWQMTCVRQEGGECKTNVLQPLSFVDISGTNFSLFPAAPSAAPGK